MKKIFKSLLFVLPLILFLFIPFKNVYAVLEPVMVKDIYEGSWYASPWNICSVEDTIYFVAGDGVHGQELWKSDGTSTGTVMVKDINIGSGNSSPYNFTAIGTTLYFSANDGVYGDELWKSDGTEAGTVMVKDIYVSDSSSPNYLTVMGTTLYFSATDGTNGYELWKSDGTEAGTVMVKDIYVSGSSSPDNLTVMGTTLYFSATDGTNGIELWKSNGTAEGTVMVKDIYSGTGYSSPSYLTAVGNTLYFGASDGIKGWELWKSDGTSNGTALVKDINDGINHGGDFNVILGVGSTLYFSANNGINGVELWKSDGTEEGTVMIKDIYIGNGSSLPSYQSKFFTSLENIFYFSANDGVYGDELWKSDGTEDGTVMVKNIFPGEWNSGPDNLTTLGNTLYFSAFGDGIGVELYKSDGTTEGTVLVKDINPGSNWSEPSVLTAVGDTLYFRASDGVFGQELWKLDVDILPPVGSININSDAQSTLTPSVSLTLNATDTLSEVSEMILCDNETFTDCNWEPYSTTKSWTLTNTSGIKTIYVKYKDSEGNISEVYSDDIQLLILPTTFGNIVSNIENIQTPSNTETELVFTQIGMGSITFPSGLDLVTNYNQLSTLGENLVVLYEPSLNRFKAYVSSTGASFLATNGATIKFFNVSDQLGIDGLTSSNFKTLLKVSVLDESKNVVNDTSSYFDWNNASYNQDTDILTMPVNHFSEYVLGVNTGVLPSTGMSPYTLLIPSGLLLIGLGIVVISRKKKENF